MDGKVYNFVQPGSYTNPGAACVYTVRPGDMLATIEGLGIAVRHADGKTILFGPGTPGHRVELDALQPPPHWRAPC